MYAHYDCDYRDCQFGASDYGEGRPGACLMTVEEAKRQIDREQAARWLAKIDVKREREV